MNYRLFAPSRIITEVGLPASKSISNRMLILNALCGGSNELLANVAHCDDTDAMVAALCSADEHINIGAAGTAMRFLTSYFSTQNGRSTILDGSERMRHRPIAILVDALKKCGADIEYLGEQGFPPLRIIGKHLSAEAIEIPGNVSSQYISAILMIAPLMNCHKITLTSNLISTPYIKMTLSLMRLMGVDSSFSGNVISINADASYSPRKFVIENDWSAASYWFELQAMLPQSRISLKGLLPHSVQGDSEVANLFSQFGIRANQCGTYVDLSATATADSRITMDLTDTPDLAQTIVVTACLSNRHFHISGLQTLKIKETDRIEALRSQLLKLGYVIDVLPDLSLQWNGNMCKPECNPHIATFADHRMAMAFAPAAVKFPGIVIDDIEVVSKSYPDFWEHLEAAGFRLEAVSGKEADE